MTAYVVRTKSLGVAFLLILSGMASLPITQAFGDEFNPYIKVQMGEYFYEVKGNDKGTPLRVKAGQVFWIVLKNNGKFAHEISWGRNLIDKGNYYDGYRENLLENVQVNIIGEKFELVANDLTYFRLDPGQEAELEMTLPAEVIGEWEMGCFISPHYQNGMHLKFIVE
jgi:uncharacterized cupredoxin-like copper-binding protein